VRWKGDDANTANEFLGWRKTTRFATAAEEAEAAEAEKWIPNKYRARRAEITKTSYAAKQIESRR
jgi:hypothetical protein